MVGEVDRRQVSYLVLCEIESDAVGGYVFDGADRNGDLLLAPEVALLEKDMRHVVIVGIDNESLHPPDIAIGGMYVFAAANLHLARRNTVLNDHLGTACHTRATHPYATQAAAEPVVGPRERLPSPVAHRLSRSGQEMCLLGLSQRVELSRAAPQADLLGARVNQVDRDQSTLSLPVLRLDDQVRENASDRIDDDAPQVSADPVATRDLNADGVLGHVAHKGSS